MSLPKYESETANASGIQTPQIKDVSDTSFWVAYYRAKESERGDALFHDRFAKNLIGPRGKQISDSMGDMGRYAEWSVISRTLIIDRFIEQLVKDGVDAVINLGAGLDARPYRMNLPENLEWIEVDYPHIITHKTKVLEFERPTCRLTRIQADLATSERRQEVFNNIVPSAKKVLILTEGVLPYLTAEQVTALANDLSAQTRFQYWIAEYFHPSIYPILQRSVRTSKMQNAPFKFYPEDWFLFFKNLGWGKKEIRYSSEIALEFDRKFPAPKWASFIMPFLPKKIKEASMRMAGHVVFTRSTN